MGYSLRVHPEHRLGIVTLIGYADGPELVRALHALTAHPDWAPGFHTVWDARYLRVFDLAPDDLPAFTAATKALAKRVGGGRSAVLCRHDDDEVTVRLLTLRGRGHPAHELQAFLSWREGARWLGVPMCALDMRLDWQPALSLRWGGKTTPSWPLRRGATA